uniref:Translocon-associated protein subunit alpha n=1 Tax=Meloidogyne incognita TaxID=6306 RepID=A0A914MCC3_MELIC
MRKFQLFILSFCVFILFYFVPSFIRAENDAVEDEEIDNNKNKEEIKEKENSILKDDTENGNQESMGPSPDVQTSCILTSLKGGPNSRELIAGQIVKVLIGIANKGERDLIVKSCETSFRYPLDFSYYTQNSGPYKFSTVRYERLVQPKQEATFDYAFIPSDVFIGRPLGLVVDLHYVDTDGQYFVSAVFNETVTITEDETGFNTETYFIYLILAGFVVILGLIAHHYITKFTRSSSGKSTSNKPSNNNISNVPSNYEMGTNKNDVDFEWIPRNNLDLKSAQKTTPSRNRKQPRQAAAS